MSDWDVKVPDSPEPIIGWRLWRIVHWEYVEPDHHIVSRLVSWTDSDIWDLKRPTRAECSASRHFLHPVQIVPSRTCACGLYAWRTIHDALAYLGQDSYACYYHWVFGQVALFGTVIEHKYGYRAQWAKPVAVVTSSDLRGASCGYSLPEDLPVVPIRELGVDRTVEDTLVAFAENTAFCNTWVD
jgi:hypothetical protein